MVHTDRFADATLRDVEQMFTMDPAQHIALTVLLYVWYLTPVEERLRFLETRLTPTERQAAVRRMGP